MKPIARVGDKVTCFCGCDDCSPCPPGAITTGVSTVIIENKPAATVSSLSTNCCGCCCPCPNYILIGSTRTIVANQPLARINDPVGCGKIITSSIRTISG